MTGGSRGQSRVGRRDLRQFFPKLATTCVSSHHRSRQIQNALGGLLRVYAASMNVRNEVAIGVCVRGFRPIRHVSRETFGGGQARPFANQENGNLGRQQFSNLIENTYSAVANDKDRRRCSIVESWLLHEAEATAGELAWQRRSLRAHRRSRFADRIPLCNAG